MPTRRSAEPIRAWKLADVDQVVTHSGRQLLFVGIGHSSRYDVDDVALCGKGRQHRVPAIDCTCGFWALPDRDAAIGAGMGNYSPPSRWLLEVELYGRVVRFDRGYRAERQRMLAVTVPGQCRVASCAQPGRFLVVGDDTQIVAPVCPTHALGRGNRVTLAELRASLGTEVSAPLLAPDDEPLPRPDPAPQRAAGDPFEVLSALVFSTQGIAPAELFELLQGGIVQRFQLPGINPAGPVSFDIRTSQGEIWLRFLHANGTVLWQCVLRAGRAHFDPTDPTSWSAKP